jgi:hypothetical protein
VASSRRICTPHRSSAQAAPPQQHHHSAPARGELMAMNSAEGPGFPQSASAELAHLRCASALPLLTSECMDLGPLPSMCMVLQRCSCDPSVVKNVLQGCLGTRAAVEALTYVVSKSSESTSCGLTWPRERLNMMVCKTPEGTERT